MRLGYILLDDLGASQTLQQASMVSGQVDGLGGDAPRIYLDQVQGARAGATLLDRDQLIADLRPGDVVVVHSMDRLGRSGKDLLLVMRDIGARGGVIFDVQAGQTVSCTPEVIRSIEAYLRGDKSLIDLHTAMMRRQKAVLGDVAKGGGRPRWTRAEIEAVKPIWFDLTKTEAEAVALAGIPGRTLLRYLGRRGRPLFGREPAAQESKQPKRDRKKGRGQ